MKYYVRLVQSKGWISLLIEFKESEWTSHVELLECDNYDVPRRALGSRYPAGIQIREPYAFHLSREWWYTVKVPSDSCERAWAAMEKLIGHRYDLLDIFAIGLDKDWHDDGRFICSEAVAWAFEQVGSPLFNPYQPVRRIWPRDYLLTPRLSLYKRIIS